MLTCDAVVLSAWSRPMECASHDPAAERLADCSVIRDLVRSDEYERIDHGRDERCDRGR